MKSEIYLKRHVDQKIEQWYQSDKKILFIYGARQVGKSKSINHFLDDVYKHKCYSVNISDIKDTKKLEVFKKDSNENNGLSYIENVLAELSPYGQERDGKIIFLDEIQDVSKTNDFEKDNKLINHVFNKLLKEKNYRFIVSGSLLGVKLKSFSPTGISNIESIKMYPITFNEFCLNFDKNYKKDIKSLKIQIDKKVKAIDKTLHIKFLELFAKYFYVGGMPACVASYYNGNNHNDAYKESESFRKLYSEDIKKYLSKSISQTYQEEWIYKIADGVMNTNKEEVNKTIKNDETEQFHNLLIKSDIALSVEHIEEKEKKIKEPLKNKLYFNDVSLFRYGLFKGKPKDLNLMYEDFTKQISGKKGYCRDRGFETEQIIAQQLKSKYEDLYYYYNDKTDKCEIEFIISNGLKTIGIESKSGGFGQYKSIKKLSKNICSIMFSYLPYCGKFGNNLYALPIYSILFIDPFKYIKKMNHVKENSKLKEVIKTGRLPLSKGFYQ